MQSVHFQFTCDDTIKYTNTREARSLASCRHKQNILSFIAVYTTFDSYGNITFLFTLLLDVHNETETDIAAEVLQCGIRPKENTVSSTKQF